MRIISGTFRGKKLIAPQGDTTRPTSDRAKETLFNLFNTWLLKTGHHWEEISFADVFAGSGAIGIEAASRGARMVSLFENDPKALACIQKNKESIPRVQVYTCSALAPPPSTEPVDILFMDAPYGKQLWQQALTAFNRAGWIGSRTMVVIETDEALDETSPIGWRLIQDRHAGRNRFLFLRKDTTA